MARKPLWISVSGIDGCGKSTLAYHLMNYFEHNQIPCRKLSMLPQGFLRDALLSATPVNKFQELLITRALHEQAYKDVSRQLSQGSFVLMDRGPDCMIAYQGYGSGLIEEIDKINAISKPPFRPDLTIFIDAPPDLCRERLATRGDELDQFEQRDEGFHHRVYEAYKRMAQEDKNRVDSGEQRYPQYYVVDGYLSEKQVAADVKLHLDFLLEAEE